MSCAPCEDFIQETVTTSEVASNISSHRRKRKWLIPIIILAAILLMAAVAIFFYYEFFTVGVYIRSESLYSTKNQASRQLTYNYDVSDTSIIQTTISNNIQISKMEFIYDVAGNVVSFQTASPSEGRTYEYDTNGNLVKEIWNDSYRVYSYDSRGNCIEQISYREGKEHLRYTYRYNSHNNRIEYSTFYDGTLAVKNVCSYDTNGNLIKNLACSYSYDYINDTTQEEQHYTVFLYNSRNQVIERANYRDGEKTYHIVYDYDSNGNLLSEIQYSSGKISSHYTYVYDNQNKLIEETRITNGIDTHHHTYQYTFMRMSKEDAQRLKEAFCSSEKYGFGYDDYFIFIDEGLF